MNILLDKLPTYVTVGGENYKINSDFRASISFEIVFQDRMMKDEEKVLQGLKLYYPVLPHDIDEAVTQLLWFYGGGKCQEEIEAEERAVPGKKQERIYCFEHDAPYIYAAFLTQYKIDLNEIEYLHWWKFKALFSALDDDLHIKKIMGYRSMDTNDSDLSKKQKEHYRKMKKLYALPVLRAEKQKLNEIEEALLAGRSIEGLV